MQKFLIPCLRWPRPHDSVLGGGGHFLRHFWRKLGHFLPALNQTAFSMHDMRDCFSDLTISISVFPYILSDQLLWAV